MLTRRYTKNIGTLGEEGQQKLFSSHIAIAGAGGLGGTVLEILARYGVGRITIVDFDSFEETNLNRQILSTEDNIGTNKTVAAATRTVSINSDIEVTAIAERLTDDNAKGILKGAELVCDCLGNIHDRFVLERAARKLGIPMVHAAIAGELGQIMNISPDGAGLASIYGEEDSAPKSGEETESGTPPSSVMAVASIQAHETIKILLRSPNALRDELLRIDLADRTIKRLAMPRSER